MVRHERALRPLTQDRLTIGGMTLWIVGTLAAAAIGAGEPARGIAAVVALCGLTAWAGGPLRAARLRRLAGDRGPLASRPSLAVLALGTTAGLLMLVAAIALWATV